MTLNSQISLGYRVRPCLRDAKTVTSLNVQARRRIGPALGDSQDVAHTEQFHVGRSPGWQGQAHLNMAMSRLSSRILATSKKTMRSSTTSQLAYWDTQEPATGPSGRAQEPRSIEQFPGFMRATAKGTAGVSRGRQGEGRRGETETQSDTR